MAETGTALLGFAVVANISDYLRGGRDENRFYQGTPKFSSSTRVYLGEGYWGMGGESIHVIGLRRISRRFVNAALTSALLTDIRVVPIYSPKIWTVLDRPYGKRFEDRTEAETYCARVTDASRAALPQKLRPREGPWGIFKAEGYRKGE